VVAGFSNASGGFDFALARYNPNGTLDPDFGCATPGSCTGKALTDFGSDDSAFAIAIQTDGKIVAAGRSGDAVSGAVDFALARYQGGFLAGTPGQADCQGDSASALTQQFGSLSAAASALGFSSVKALQDAIRMHCGQ
jgi:hypothetical protein